MSDTVIKIENLRKQYRLGTIGGTTLNAELQSWWARKRGKEDPNLKIGQDYSNASETFWALDGVNLEVEKGEALWNHRCKRCWKVYTPQNSIQSHGAHGRRYLGQWQNFQHA